MKRLPRVVACLLLTNILVFVAGYFLHQGQDSLVGIGALWYPANKHFELWQIGSYMFLHAGLGHLFFNMFALVSFGKILEAEWGASRFLTFYLICGVGAALIQTGVNWHAFHDLQSRLVGAGLTPAEIKVLLETGRGLLPADPVLKETLFKLYQIYAGPMLGASGAIYGVLVAFGLRHPNAKLGLIFIPVPVAAKYFIPGLLVFDLLSGVTGISLFGASVAHYAHLGGALIGFLLMLLWRKRGRGVSVW